LEAIEKGEVTHVDEDGMRQLKATSAEDIAKIRDRLAKLNARLGDDSP
jgi:hypothetical protein